MSKVGIGEKKYVIIPEAYPLFAMTKIFGPKTGPLSRPTPVPITIIGELLQQTGKTKVTIYEVVPVETDKKTGQPTRFSDPVQLSLGNYTLPYEEIKNGKSEAAPTKVVIESVPEKIEIKPEIVKNPIEPPKDVLEANAAATAESIKAFSESEEGKQTVSVTVASPAPVVEEPVVDQPKTEEVPAEPVAEETKPEEPVERADDVDETQSVADPWPGMTDQERSEYNAMSKAEKKAARRAHREQASEG